MKEQTQQKYIRRSIQEQERLLADHEASGLSVKHFCHANKLSPATFYAIRKRLQGRVSGSEKQTNSKKRGAFLELTPSLAQKPPQNEQIKLVMHAQELELHCSPLQLSDVLHTLKHYRGY